MVQDHGSGTSRLGNPPLLTKPVSGLCPQRETTLFAGSDVIEFRWQDCRIMTENTFLKTGNLFS